jgi:hypothetical protein
MIRDLERLSAERGLVFHSPNPFPQASLLPARIAVSGLEDGWVGDFTRAVFEGQFANGLQLDDAASLSRILDQLGLDSARILALSSDQAVKDRLRKNTADAQAYGIFGAPTFRTSDGEIYWGDDRLDQAIRAAAILWTKIHGAAVFSSREYLLYGCRHQPLEMTAVKTKTMFGMGVSAAAAALALMTVTASAQLAPTAPKAPAPAATPATPAAPAAPKAPVAATPAKPAAKAAAVVCKGLDEATCKGKAPDCAYIVPTKISKGSTTPDKPYCRKVAGVAKKAADAKAAVGAAATKAGAAASSAATSVKSAVTPAAKAPTAPTAPKQ